MTQERLVQDETQTCSVIYLEMLIGSIFGHVKEGDGEEITGRHKRWGLCVCVKYRTTMTLYLPCRGCESLAAEQDLARRIKEVNYVTRERPEATDTRIPRHWVI